MARALNDVRVLDLAGAPAVFAARLLADLGADVIRIEPRDGGSLRRMAPFLDEHPDVEHGLYHLYHNAGKRSVTLDIEAPAGHDILMRLVETADVLIQTATPATAETQRLEYDDFRAVNPHLIYVSVTPFGERSPWRNRKTTDLVAAASGGLLHLTGHPEDPPTQGGADPAYKMASLAAASAVMVALTGRDLAEDESGAHLDISIQECVAMAVLQTANANLYQSGGVIPGRPGMHPPIYRCADDRWISLRVRPDRFDAFLRWCEESGIETELTGDGLEELQAQGDINRSSELVSLVEQLASAHASEELLRRAWALDLIGLPITSFPDMLRIEHFVENEQFVDIPDEVVDRTLQFPRSPVDAMAGGIDLRRAPRLGEHNAEVYGQLGLSKDSLSELTAQGVI